MKKPILVRERIGKLRLVTIAEAAKDLKLSEGRVRVLCQQGRLGQQFGRTYVIDAEELQAFKKKPRPKGRPPGAKNKQPGERARTAPRGRKS